MSSVNPKLLIALVAAIVVVVFVRMNNPYRQYSTEEFWLSATVADVNDIPDEALDPGNKNGAVLMWAAMVTKDPAVLSVLVDRGANIKENDPVFQGTPLSAAAGFSSSPAVIDELIRLGADIHQKVDNNRDALMVSALYNKNPGIIERLIFHGAATNNEDVDGNTALELARMSGNNVAVAALEK